MSGIDNNTLLYLRGDSFTDLSLNPKTITNNGVVSEAGGIFGKRLFFNQNSFDVPIQFGTSNFTIEFFFNAKVWQAGSGASRLFSTGAYSATNAFTCEIGSATINFFIGSIKHTIDTSTLTLNHNHHMAFVRNGNNYYVFIDGKQRISTTRSNLNFNAYTYTRFGGNAVTTAGEYYYGYMENLRVSNIARYTGEFQVPTAPYTSVSVDNIALNELDLSCNVNKLSSNETINKVDIMVNSNIAKSYTSNYNPISYTINNANLSYGNNNIEVRAYYYGDYYVYASTSYIKELILEEFEPIAALPTTASFDDVIVHLGRVKFANRAMLNNLQILLEDKGFSTGENPRLSTLIKVVKDLSNSNSADITEYINQIIALENEITNAKINLKTIYSKKGVSFSEEVSLNNLISLLNDYSFVDILYLYNNERTTGNSAVNQYTLNNYYPGTMTVTSNGVSVVQSSSQVGNIIFGGTINLTPYSKLCAEVKATKFTNSVDHYLPTLCLFSTTNDANAEYGYIRGLYTIETQTIVLDISNLSCTCYVGLQCMGVDYIIYKFWLE